MDVRVLIDGRVVWVKSHVLGRWERPLRKQKKEENMQRKMGRMESFVIAVSNVSFFLFSKTLCLVCVWCLGCSSSFSVLKPF